MHRNLKETIPTFIEKSEAPLEETKSPIKTKKRKVDISIPDKFIPVQLDDIVVRSEIFRGIEFNVYADDKERLTR